jgi:DUF4097 and DUF4098 domain-containing protein YvlB
MMPLSFRLASVAAAVLLTAWPAAAQNRREAEETERISRKFTIGENGRFTLANISGNVTLSSGSGDEVVVEAVKRTRGERRELASVVVEFDERPGRLEVRTRHTARRDRASVDFTVTVPRAATVDLSSISGNVRVSGLLGALRANSVSGSVVVSDSSNVESAKSMSGNVELTGSAADGRLTASTISGTVRARDLKARALAVSSVSGNAELSNVEAERLEAKSVSGHVIFDGAAARNGRYEFSTHSGDVRLTLASSPGFELRASTFGGSIRSDLPVTVGGSRARGRGRSTTAVVGDGSASLNASTFSGSIVIGRR